MRFLLTICHDGPVEIDAGHRAWLREMTDRGMLITGARLAPVAAAVRVRSGETVVSAGPGEDFVDGFFLLDCADLSEAIAAAASHPTASRGRVEIRPLTGR